MRMNQKQDIKNNKITNQQFQYINRPINGLISQIVPEKPKDEVLKPIDPIKPIKEKKQKFTIANNKEEIISDIIDLKPTMKEVRKALKIYSEISQIENNNI